MAYSMVYPQLLFRLMLDMSKYNFIKTDNDELAAQLRAANFSYLGKDTSNLYVFVNDGTYDFSESINNKLIYTNLLTLV